jgi:hypothetical protein
MRRLCAKRWFRLLVLLLATPCLAGLLACWWFRIWSFADYQVYEEVRREAAAERGRFGGSATVFLCGEPVDAEIQQWRKRDALPWLLR